MARWACVAAVLVSGGLLGGCDCDCGGGEGEEDGVCGDGFVDPGEECDDGNDANTDACVTGCLDARYGDGFVEEGVEECDDGNDVDTDACVGEGQSASCGDGFVEEGVEDCDDGNGADTDACVGDCVEARYGDGFVQEGVEDCDDGNDVDTDGCVGEGELAACGDGFVQEGVEDCEDGNDVDTDACVGDCAEARYGDGFVQEGVEDCDDGNDVDTDGCTAGGELARCGDGFVQEGVEECDGGDGCNPDCTMPCGVAGDCGDGQRCAYETCVPEVACEDGEDCAGDSYCEGGFCIPWGLPAGVVGDVTCTRTPDLGAFEVVEQCHFAGPPEGDPAFGKTQVGPSAVVADLDMDEDPATIATSIVVNAHASGSWQTDASVLIIDGRTCTLQQSLTEAGDETNSSAPPTIGDLDGDGSPEIISPRSGGGMIAFTRVGGAFERLWTSAECDDGGNRVEETSGATLWGGASIHDLDDDGVPEVIHGATVYDADGCVLDSAYGMAQVSQGQIPVLADPDRDGEIEWISGNQLLRWDGDHFDAEAGFVAPGADGLVAVGDFGEFPGTASEPAGIAEVVVVSGGTVRIQTIAGEVIFGSFALPGGGTGGAPTIADFDGDGRREAAVAGATEYVVFDLDCDFDPVPAGCQERGVLWSQTIQDASSNVTGSSVFDFEGDGPAEVVYADECFLRVFDGATGTVKWSGPRLSGTWYELPVIADVDGDFRTEIVVTENDEWGTLGCPATDPLYPDAVFRSGTGVTVYADTGDQWVSSRPIWNQHAYSVTNVGDDGSIPRTSEWVPNWSEPALNNFRVNIQGSLNPLAVPNLTVRCTATPSCQDAATIAIDCDVCNRGAEGVDAGVSVGFDTEAGASVCLLDTQGALLPGDCEPVACTWDPAPVGDPTDLTITVDLEGEVLECLEGDSNTAFLPGLTCP